MKETQIHCLVERRSVKSTAVENFNRMLVAQEKIAHFFKLYILNFEHI